MTRDSQKFLQAPRNRYREKSEGIKKKRKLTFFSSSKHSRLYLFCSSFCLTCTPFSASTFNLTSTGKLSIYPELFPRRSASFPWTIPSICCSRPARVGSSPPSAVEISPSLSSVMSGTVGRESPSAMGAWDKGVFWGVGAVRLDPPEMGTLDDMMVRQKKKKKKEVELKDHNRAFRPSSQRSLTFSQDPVRHDRRLRGAIS